MENILAPRSGLIHQPANGIFVNWANPITQGLVIAFVGGQIGQNQVRRQPVTSRGGATYTTTSKGAGYNFAAQTTACIQLNATTLLTGADGDYRGGMTVCLLANPAAAGIVTIPFSVAPAANEWFMLFNSTKNVAGQSGSFSVGGQSGMGQTYPNKVDGNFHLFSCVWSRATLSIAQLYVDAVPSADVSTAAPAALSTSACRDNIGGYSSASYTTFNCNHNLTLAWNRSLSPAEIASLSANPWQVFGDRSFRNFDQLAAAAGGNPYRLRALMGVGF